ncbi:pseudouridine synthase [Synechococcus sp. UW179A]|uniref:pseudouridine synthase n=1 Tax=Synechococcus sp. UW179A TaxID=2575510 RepID=UPI000E0E12C7|nr:pseudouridine synthase [Synechococcus sp. UW179A]
MRQRLQKLMSAAGHCSRRQAEELLRQGRIHVNGTIAALGDQADPETDLICVDGTPLAMVNAERVLLLNKPAGVISSCHDPQGRETVLDLIPAELRKGLHPVGRLDADSRGALLLSNQGELTFKLTHPRYAHSKTYRVTVTGTPDHSKLERWRQGMQLDGSRTLPASVKLLHSKRGHSTLEVILREGRNRQIRRIASLLGHSVLDLQRIAIAGLALGSTEEGCWRELSRQEWRSLISSQAGEA